MSPRAIYTQMNGVFVSAYKLFGFATLALILFGLIAYVFIQVFYLVNTSWVAPVILSPSHERVLELNAKLFMQRFQRDKLRSDCLLVQAEIDSLERTVAVTEALQSQFGQTVDEDLNARQKELGQLVSLLKQHRATRGEIEKQSDAFSGLNKERLEQDYEAKLIDRDAYVNGNFQLARQEQMGLNMTQQEAQLNAQVEILVCQVNALRALRSTQGKGAAHICDVFALEQERARLELEAAAAKGRIAPLKEQITIMEQTVSSFDEIIAAIEASPYLRAFRSTVNLAFVPYENRDSVKKGDPVYGCAFSLVWCKEVGTVVNVLEGEVAAKHPLLNRDMRGLMAEIKLTEERWGEELALHVGSAPFWL
jgi:hypothetical protein